METVGTATQSAGTALRTKSYLRLTGAVSGLPVYIRITPDEFLFSSLKRVIRDDCKIDDDETEELPKELQRLARAAHQRAHDKMPPEFTVLQHATGEWMVIETPEQILELL